MKFGINTFTWVSPFTSENLDVFHKVKDLGFEVVEIGLENISGLDTRKVKQALGTTGLECTVCAVTGQRTDITSDDPSIRENAKKYLRDCIEICARLEAELLSGPIYSAVGKARLVSPEQREKEWNLCMDTLDDLSEFALRRGVTIAVEPLNRFETDLINTAQDAVRLVRSVGSPALKIHLDTFHMNVEEKSLGQAIRDTGAYLYHFHACENDRGTPGTGHIPWPEVASALKDIGYDGHIVMESFTPENKNLAEALRIWRKFEVDQDTLARDGLKFLRRLFGQPA